MRGFLVDIRLRQIAIGVTEVNTHRALFLFLFCGWLLLAFSGVTAAQNVGEKKTTASNTGDTPEKITDKSCEECHSDAIGKVKPVTQDRIAKSVHQDIGCLDCHTSITAIPHAEKLPGADCSACHDEISQNYKQHGRGLVHKLADVPTCGDCHGSHNILPLKDKSSPLGSIRLPVTCSRCHENRGIQNEKRGWVSSPVSVYLTSVHSKASKKGPGLAASCSDCHFTNHTGHQILPIGDSASTVNYFHISRTCGSCHDAALREYSEGIHGQLLARGRVESPSCTKCHGEHRILSPMDPKSPISSYRLAEETCEPCHESAVLNEKYSLTTKENTSRVDSFHGLKSKLGGKTVANCASCHGAHRILPSSDPRSSVHKSNLSKTCGGCHKGITDALATIPIHQAANPQWTGWARIIEVIYIFLIIAVIGGMLLYVTMDLFRHIRKVMGEKHVKRMETSDIVQHMTLAVSFTALVVTGFALRHYDAWYSKLLFGFEGGYQLRGLIHRVAAIALILASFVHIGFLFTRRGRVFLNEIIPRLSDIKHAFEMLSHNWGSRPHPPQMGRFTFAEKIEYWAVVWGTAIMAVTGCILWLKSSIAFPKILLDLCLVIHVYEAWLAFLAILVWHLYHTVFSPKVYPINMSWLTGKVPERVFREEHAGVVEPSGTVPAERSGGSEKNVKNNE